MTLAVPAFRLPDDLDAGTVESVVSAMASAYVQTGRGDGGVLLDCIEPTVVAVSLAGQLVRDGEVDRVIVATAVERTGFWVDQIGDFTGLTTLCHYGTGREQRLARMEPQALVSTLETLRGELARHVKVEGTRGKRWEPGPLVDLLGLYGSRTLWILDQVGKLDHRGTETYGAVESFFRETRKHTHQRLLGLYPPDLDDAARAFSVGRIFCPSRMPSVADFDTHYCFPLFAEEPVLRPARREEFHRLFSGAFIR